MQDLKIAAYNATQLEHHHGYFISDSPPTSVLSSLRHARNDTPPSLSNDISLRISDRVPTPHFYEHKLLPEPQVLHLTLLNISPVPCSYAVTSLPGSTAEQRRYQVSQLPCSASVRLTSLAVERTFTKH